MSNLFLSADDVKEAFYKAQYGAGNLLVHVRGNHFNLDAFFSGPSFHCFHTREETVLIEDRDFAPLIEYFKRTDRPRIGGIYDLSKTFRDARQQIDVLPVNVQKTISDIAFSKEEDTTLLQEIRQMIPGLRPRIPSFQPSL